MTEPDEAGSERAGSLEVCMAQKANMEAIFHSVADGILTLDTELRVVHLNRAAASMLGTGSDEAAGRGVGEVLRGRLWDVEALARSTLDEGVGVEGRENLLGVRGEREIRVLLTTSRLHDRRGEVGGAVVVLRDITHERELEARLERRTQLHALAGRSHAMQELYALIENVARTDSTVLIQGESGTGKELVADAIHRSSARAGGPFVKVNCSALSEGILESELFGHVKGAFTGALHDRAGRFELADRGTLLLDEVGDLPAATQVKLLRVLQEREIERVGDSRVRKVDVRILAATHRALRRLVEEGRFREDLFYRLNVIPVRLPPLREHREDVPVLVARFLAELADVTGKRIARVSPDALRVLVDHDWPGNVRELRNAVEHAMVKSRGPMLLVEDLPRELLEEAPVPARAVRRPASGERARVLEALERARWNRAAAARILGIDRSTLWRRMRKLDVRADAS
jgi:PAS domain S-box-containing protein